jgi:uncharacterized protein (UPF0276 family)
VPRSSPAELRALAALPQGKLTHGVGFPVGGTFCDQERHVGELRNWTERLGSPWTSEHLSILDVPGAGGARPCGYLMPPLQTDAQVTLAVANITRRAAVMAKPFAFETGVNYFAPRPGEMSDGDFFAAIAETADCGILLDLNNLWVNAKNGRAKIDAVVARLPLARVWEVHLAGAEFAHDYWLDAHCGGIDPELTAIAADIVAGLPNLGAIIFEIAPDRLSGFGGDAILREMETLHRLWDIPRPAAAVAAASPAATPRFLTEGQCGLTPEAWERLIAVRMLPVGYRPATAGEEAQLRQSDEQSFALYARLTASFRFSAIADLLTNSIRLLLIAMGKDALRDLLGRYTVITPPSVFPTDEALGFRRFVEAHAASIPGLSDVLAFEAAAVEAAANGRPVRITLARDLGAVFDDIAVGRLPGPHSERPRQALEIGVNPQPFIRLVGTQSRKASQDEANA